MVVSKVRNRISIVHQFKKTKHKEDLVLIKEHLKTAVMS